MSRRSCLLLLIACLGLAGCGPSALSPGSSAPKLTVAGWANGDAPHPDDLQGRVVVLDVFATW